MSETIAVECSIPNQFSFSYSLSTDIFPTSGDARALLQKKNIRTFVLSTDPLQDTDFGTSLQKLRAYDFVRENRACSR